MDVLGRFIEECCLVDSNATVKSSALYEAYKKWCEANREYAGTQKAFSLRLKERGFDKKKLETGWWWYGIGLLTGCDFLTGSDGSFSMNNMNTSREGLYGKTRQDPSDPSGESPGQSDGTYLPAEGIGSADDLYEKAVMRAKPWLPIANQGPKRPKVEWTRTGTDNK